MKKQAHIEIHLEILPFFIFEEPSWTMRRKRKGMAKGKTRVERTSARRGTLTGTYCTLDLQELDTSCSVCCASSRVGDLQASGRRQCHSNPPGRNLPHSSECSGSDMTSKPGPCLSGLCPAQISVCWLKSTGRDWINYVCMPCSRLVTITLYKQDYK